MLSWMDITMLGTNDKAIAKLCGKRLEELLKARFGIRRGELVERVAQAAPYLPDATQRRLKDLALDLTQISQGLVRINDRDSWRANVDAMLSAVESSGPYVRVTPRWRLGWWWHTLFLAVAGILYLKLPEFVGITTGPWTDRLATWVGMGYLYWAWDRGLQMGWPPSRTRAVLRCLLVLLLGASPVVIVMAVLNLRNYARSTPVESDGSSYSSNEGWPHDTSVTNPATGLPMDGAVDAAGNTFGAPDD